jgi:hypothetical protein
LHRPLRRTQLTVRAARQTLGVQVVADRGPATFCELRDTLRTRLGWSRASAVLALADAIRDGEIVHEGEQLVTTAARAAT